MKGFGLLELLIALAVTLVVSAAIYGLLLTGQTAFQREPELTDRQQRIRMAMDSIQRDVYSAGMSLPPFAQIFIPGLAGGPVSDSLELFTCDGMGPVLAVRYEIRPDGLWRGEAMLGSVHEWQLIAGGIDVLRVWYRDGRGLPEPAPWRDSPPAVTDGDWGTIVREVKVMLTARTMAGPIRRSSLTTLIVPRAALIALTAGVGPAPDDPQAWR